MYMYVYMHVEIWLKDQPCAYAQKAKSKPSEVQYKLS